MRQGVIGSTIGNYLVRSLIGEGGMGHVYLAEHPGLARKSAIKILRPELCSDEQLVSRLFNEARAANAIRHPAIVDIYDYGRLPGGAPYIAMEYLEGESLSTRLRRGRPALASCLDIAAQIAAGLAAAHQIDIIHRDLKPDNLFLVQSAHEPGRERVKILDFGIAKLNRWQGLAHRTRTGALMGTPTYMSPEQCRGLKEVDARTDIYSLGLIVYEMLCGRPPFVSEGVGELVNLHINAAPAPPSQHNPEVGRTLEAVILRALEKDPEHRFAGMSEMEDALRTELGRLGIADGAGKGATLRGVTATATAAQAGATRTRLPSMPSPHTLTGRVADHHRTTMPVLRRRVSTFAVLMVLGVAGAGLGWFILERRLTIPERPPVAAMPARRERPVAPAPAVTAATVSVSLASEPPGATVKVDDVVIATTPAEVKLPADGGAKDFLFALEGHVEQTIKAIPSNGLKLSLRLTPVAPAPRPRVRARPRPRAAPAEPAPRPAAVDDIKFSR